MHTTRPKISTFHFVYIESYLVTCPNENSYILERVLSSFRAAAHQMRQDKHQDMRQKTQSCFIRDSNSSPHTKVARVCVLSHLL
jgi:hypothetical protein